MSRRWLRLFAPAAAIAVCVIAGGFGFAEAQSLQAMLDGALAPSAAPALLGPINEDGRVGWACKPERAAGARSWQDAELPRP
ncbi:MAG TPA: hypothetical protein VGR69_01410 [Candidatus Rubrimentiphilum sp.]|nr:hypothetical protein [Candidatus Rubrimentiphilum sp.]